MRTLLVCSAGSCYHRAGRLAVLDSLASLQSAYRPPGYALTVRHAAPSTLVDGLAPLGAAEVDVAGERVSFVLPDAAPIGLYDALAALGRLGAEIVSVQQQEVNLEAIYRRIVEGGG